MDKIQKEYGVFSIRNRILVFALLITLVPSFGMGWLLNNTMQANVSERSEQKLQYATNIIQREISLWFKERDYDLNVFSNSYVISENIAKYLATEPVEGTTEGSQGSLREIAIYLASLKDQFDDYQQLFVLDKKGGILASSSSGAVPDGLQLPPDVEAQIEQNRYFRGEVYFDELTNSARIILGTPLYSEQFNGYVGILAVEVGLNGILSIMDRALEGLGQETDAYSSLVRLVDGAHFLTTSRANPVVPGTLYSKQVLDYFDDSQTLRVFDDHLKRKVLGVVYPIDEFQWGVIVAEDYNAVFARVNELGNRNIFIVCLLGLIIGIVAYLVARQIIVPLKALTEGAQQVAEGDLDVRLPVKRNDELAFATRVFNEMVSELQQNQAQLELLATTDSLTGLHNRKKILETLQSHFEHYQRYKHVFSILMVDLDYFKKINDTHGHLAGDAILRETGKLFTETLRTVDAAGRYGGEEFLIILAESEEKEARQAAKRLQEIVNDHHFTYEGTRIKVSVSIGATQTSSQDKDVDELIHRADEALYKAKNRGRNQVVFALDERTEEPAKSKVVSLPRTAEK